MLTDKECRNASCPEGRNRVRLTDAGGLYLEVSPAGSKRWFWKLYADGKESRMALGSYPDVSLAEARRARDAARLEKQKGRNPIELRKVERLKAVNSAASTFREVATEWWEKQSPQWSASHSARSLRQLERDLFPWIGSRQLREIESTELLATFRKIEQRAP